MRKKCIVFTMIMTASLIVSASLSSRLCVSDETECQQVTSYRANIINNDIYSASAADRSIMNQDVLYDKKEDLEEETRKAEEYRAEAERLMTELQDKSKEIAEVTDKLEKTNELIKTLSKAIKDMEKEISDMEERISELRTTTGDIIRMMYEEGYEDPLLFIAGEDEYDLINRNEYVKEINKYMNNSIISLNELLSDSIARTKELKDMKAEEERIRLGYRNEQHELELRLNELEKLIEENERMADNAEALAMALKIQVEQEEKKRKELARQTSNKVKNAIIRDNSGTDFFQVPPYEYTESELKLLAAIIQAEAGSVDYGGMVAVGSVVMNRVDDSRFPDTIPGVIYAPYQFEPADTGSLALILANGPEESCYMAAEDVLNGTRNVTNLYFKAKWYAEEHGISGINIGGNVFH